MLLDERPARAHIAASVGSASPDSCMTEVVALTSSSLRINSIPSFGMSPCKPVRDQPRIAVQTSSIFVIELKFNNAGHGDVLLMPPRRNCQTGAGKHLESTLNS